MMKAALKSLLFKIVRSKIGTFVIYWGFEHMTFLMPINKLIENDLVVAFNHPQPVHKVHIIIMPKKKIGSLMSITSVDFPIVNQIIMISQKLVKQLNLEKTGYRLLVNGGAYQDVKQIHFHLISDG
jgi:histidine triad (HIT) family protein